MNEWVIENIRAMQPGRNETGQSLNVSEGIIVEQTPSAVNVIDGRGGLLTPGLMDVHTHGIHTHLYEASPDALREGLACLPQYGTTSVCPTFYTVMDRASLPKLESLARVLAESLPVNVPGLHLEGPFLALPGAGAATVAGDLGLLEEILAAAQHRVAAMSVSPDTTNIIPVIERLVERNIVPFITHTQANYEQAKMAIDAGARHGTHFYDVFPPPEATDGGVRPVGAVEALLEDSRVTVDFIADGVHVHPGAIRLAVRCKGYQGVTLITDANIGSGLEEGTYDTPWGFSVKVAPGKGARNADPNHPKFGRLAGSALTMDVGINNLLSWLVLPEAQVWAMGTSNPAKLLGLKNKGSLEVGRDADLVLWEQGDDKHYRPIATWVGGVLVWSSRDDLVVKPA